MKTITNKFNDWRRRSIARLVSWRIIGGSTTAAIVYFVAKAGASAGETATIIFICQFTINALMYYIHDRIWNHFQWGREVVFEDGTTITRAEYLKFVENSKSTNDEKTV
jgi:uncharacterized membrane protein